MKIIRLLPALLACFLACLIISAFGGGGAAWAQTYTRTFYDDFNRADGPVGNNWQNASGLSISGNALQLNSGSSSPWNNDTYRPTSENAVNQRVALTTKASGGTAFTYAALRRQSAGLGLSRLDAAVSTRSTYAGGDTSGTATLLTRIGTPIGASLSADIAGVPAALFSATVDGAITLKQVQALSLAVSSGKYVSGALNTSAHTKTTTYYRQNGTSVLAVGVVTYNTANTEILGRTVTFSNLP